MTQIRLDQVTRTSKQLISCFLVISWQSAFITTRLIFITFGVPVTHLWSKYSVPESLN